MTNSVTITQEHGKPRRRVRLRSVSFASEDASQSARDVLYVGELERQARIAVHAFGKAITRGTNADSSEDTETWAALQAGLFAAIVVRRLLWPFGARTPEAEARGQRLRTLLGVDNDSPLRRMTEVRDSLEHFDERLDRALSRDVVCVSDWYITDGPLFLTPGGAGGGLGLRAFYPLGGLLLFERTLLDLFELDEAMVDLIGRAEDGERELLAKVKGRGTYGGQQILHLDEAKAVARGERWLQFREEAGYPPFASA